MEDKKYVCYICNNSVAYNEISFKRVSPSNTEIKYIGVCDLHDFDWNSVNEYCSQNTIRSTEETNTFWNDMERIIPGWNGFVTRTIEGKLKLVFSSTK